MSENNEEQQQQQQQPVAVETPSVVETSSAADHPSVQAVSGESNSEQVEDNQGENDPSVVPANAITGGRETSDKVLYVGNLDKAITEDILKQYFQVGGPIANIKIMIDKNNKNVNYAFVEYHQSHDANIALQTLNGKQIENNIVKINWAFQSQQSSSDDTFNLFVGDLNVNVDDETLRNAFKDFPSYLSGHVMWDMQTGSSRGYGFVSFTSQDDAQTAMDSMQGQDLNGRPLRINWAAKRDNNNNNNNNYPQRRNYGNNNRGGFRQYNNNNNNNMNMGMNMNMNMNMNTNRGMPPSSMGMPIGAMPLPSQGQPQQSQTIGLPPQVNPQAVDHIIRSAPPRVTTAYIGNIPHFATEADLIPLFQNFGFILDFKHYPEKGCCFIKYDTHEQAAVCIVALANFPFQGRNLRTGWGKERSNFMPQQQQQQGGQPLIMNDQQQPVMADPQQQQQQQQ
ncbi:hypothetical protein SMKI_14G3020 [Saccharomyces mikatae IFO 1815]|uniref:RRM domain-containing protein n=1 Tax=Saccharomyces mikatae IFO 1815 TaxID=226126 RepID=A0AA35ITX5_SACMI|nr:uncharacterized protein SMKI_14G3020 [Saccharomyces mikatae IFO 1815]CAI4036085.1 hypothetical protein SMKI_14G3020 [Saccharomyces mikatae IFO 1815]